MITIALIINFHFKINFKEIHLLAEGLTCLTLVCPWIWECVYKFKINELYLKLQFLNDVDSTQVHNFSSVPGEYAE